MGPSYIFLFIPDLLRCNSNSHVRKIYKYFTCDLLLLERFADVLEIKRNRNRSKTTGEHKQEFSLLQRTACTNVRNLLIGLSNKANKQMSPLLFGRYLGVLIFIILIFISFKISSRKLPIKRLQGSVHIFLQVFQGKTFASVRK